MLNSEKFTEFNLNYQIPNDSDIQCRTCSSVNSNEFMCDEDYLININCDDFDDENSNFLFSKQSNHYQSNSMYEIDNLNQNKKQKILIESPIIFPSSSSSSSRNSSASSSKSSSYSYSSTKNNFNKLKLKQRNNQCYLKRRAANMRERRRMQSINDAFEFLREHIPTQPYEKRLSKVDTLKLATSYISHLYELVTTGRNPAENAAIRRNQSKSPKIFIQCHGSGDSPLTRHLLSWSCEKNSFQNGNLILAKIWTPEDTRNKNPKLSTNNKNCFDSTSLNINCNDNSSNTSNISFDKKQNIQPKHHNQQQNIKKNELLTLQNNSNDQIIKFNKLTQEKLNENNYYFNNSNCCNNLTKTSSLLNYAQTFQPHQQCQNYIFSKNNNQLPQINSFYLNYTSTSNSNKLSPTNSAPNNNTFLNFTNTLNAYDVNEYNSQTNFVNELNLDQKQTSYSSDHIILSNLVQQSTEMIYDL